MISVITCAHNSRADYLARVLAALAAQTLPTSQWEFIVVDSGSAPALCGRVDLSWHPDARLVREDQPGLTRARLRGIAEARGELLVFVDDDNVLDSDFLAQALRISREWPMIGAWSGNTRPGFDVPPPDWTRQYWGNLAIRELSEDRWSNLPMLPDTMPLGAGLCVRRRVAQAYLDLHRSGQRPVTLDRVGNSLLSGGDNDLAMCACDIGLGVGLFKSLGLTHLMPAARLEEPYLLGLIENIAFSSVILRSFRSPPCEIARRRLKSRVGDALRLAIMDVRSRRFFRATRRGERRAIQFLRENPQTTAARPPRVFQVVEQLGRGAVENWLLRVLRHAATDNTPLDWTFYCALPQSGNLDATARELGAKVIHSPCGIGSTTRFILALRRTLRDGRCEILHCHHDVVSAVYLVASLGLGVRRVVHVHNADLEVPTPNRLRASFLRGLMRGLCLRLADNIVGISEHTLDTFLAQHARRSGRHLVQYYGVDTTPRPSADVDRSALRAQHDISPSAPLLLFVGRMVSYKNPLFVLDVLAELSSTHPDTVAMFVGSGPLESAVRERATQLGLTDRVRMLGWCDDVGPVMAAADVFVFPRLESRENGVGIEGLGLTVVEAQVSGLPVVISRGVPPDAIVIPELCVTRSVGDGPAAWADGVRSMLTKPRLDNHIAAARVEASRFSMQRSLEALQRLYSGDSGDSIQTAVEAPDDFPPISAAPASAKRV